jgi:hypothetical protein
MLVQLLLLCACASAPGWLGLCCGVPTSFPIFSLSFLLALLSLLSPLSFTFLSLPLGLARDQEKENQPSARRVCPCIHTHTTHTTQPKSIILGMRGEGSTFRWLYTHTTTTLPFARGFSALPVILIYF